ncbi:phosphotriesterase-related protein [Acrocarpospora macrocephala]|uniref:Aryldialkylphosphatase n=1 Tax=Acrocarpospora macrocephala TaxID=150177 RepID=A0A5M3WW83_9ACTN|nr:phosphotriesterase [Acrocarpospora macrocephala]GES11571.1 aryldialkylphosphatase [Acrocarpospora macrocephala]
MIETVLGPVPAEALGPVDMHEHLLLDASGLRRDGVAEPAPVHADVRPEVLGYLRWNALALADNLRLDCADTAVEELVLARAAGVGTVVEATSVGLGPGHDRLPELARRSGVHVVAAYGIYLSSVLPGWAAALDETALEEHLTGALEDHVPGTGYRAGLLGIMGTTGTVTGVERARLRAAARAAARTGAAVTVRLDPVSRSGVDVVELLTGQGTAADKVLFTNCDEFLDAPYLAELSAAGATLEMCFGTEFQHLGRLENPSDRERLDFLVRFLDAYPASRWVIGGSTWTKIQLTRYGGGGLAHPLGRMVPELARRGVPAETIAAMTVREPARLLDRS